MPRKDTKGSRRRARNKGPVPHHSVYVIEIDRAVTDIDESPLPPVYVGMTGLTPEERFANHKRGHKASRVAHRHGVRLLPALYEHLNPMSYDEALRAETELAEELRRRGHFVFGGH